MKMGSILLCAFILSGFGSGLLFAQNADDYRTAGSGDWNVAATWERYSGTAWEAASAAPDSMVGAISIQSGHAVTVTADLGVDSVNVLGGGQLTVNTGVTVTVPFNNDGRGIDIDTLGSMTVHGTIVSYGLVGGADSSIVFTDGSVYDHARNEGSVPVSIWEEGSTFRLTGTTNVAPDNTSQDFYHIVIDCPSLISNRNLGMSGNTIRGDITVLQTGASNRYYLTSPTDYEDPITINGGIYVFGGVLSSNGSSDQASIIVHTYGNVYVTSGNFGCSRGSGTSVSWYLYGDTMSVSNATLQNSTSSPDRIQKFIFAKQGTQYMRWSDVTYGASGSSPITVQVSGGTTLDIGTTYIPSPLDGGSTGSFILDSAATLVAAHNAPGDEGNIECWADLGGGNSFVNINATAGTGMTSVTATKGPHPNIYDTSKTLQRYWTVTADPGITEATLTLYYYDLDPADTEVRGDESLYKALRYAGTAMDWYTESGSSVDDVFDFVEATGVTAISGEWTVGEAAPPITGVTTDETGIPETFFVNQNFPNPFNPSTAIVYGLPGEEYVTIRVYNLLGQEVATLFEGDQSAGVHEVRFDAGFFTSGAYVYRVQAGGASIVKRMMLIK
jgi:hypothetical protein